VTEPARAPVAGIKFLYDLKQDLLDRDEHHLSDAFTGLHFVAITASIPAGNVHLPLIVRVDESRQIAEDPVGTNTVSPGFTVSGSSIQARISSPAEPSVA
jgi:hypothetical protein